MYPCAATSIYIKNRSTATIRDLFSSKEPLSDLREIMWVTTCRVPLITPSFNFRSLLAIPINEGEKKKKKKWALLRKMLGILLNDFQSSRSILYSDPSLGASR